MRRHRRVAAAALVLALQDAAGSLPSLNNAHATNRIFSQSGTDWPEATAVHDAGLRGEGQVVGLGDTGLDASVCAFADSSAEVPYDVEGAAHKRIAAYITMHGDREDGPDGHGTHVAGTIAAVAPGARLAVVDLEVSSRPGRYNVPDGNIGMAYFDFMRTVGAAVSCSPWSFEEHGVLDAQVDAYLWEHPEFLAVFPSGNAFGDTLAPHSPCSAKNVLCVGASYNARESYLIEPSFANAMLLITNATAELEVPVLPALFGPTAPLSPEECSRAADSCLASHAACPECAFASSSLKKVAHVHAVLASPRDGCSQLDAFLVGAACVVYRGGCEFTLKVQHCAQAGAVGVVVVDYETSSKTLMKAAANAPHLGIPAVLLPRAAVDALLASGHHVTFPTVWRGISPEKRAPYSSHGLLASGRRKPELLMPGDNIASAAAGQSCSQRRMSGTSQSCGFAAGAAALLREYLQHHGDEHSRLLQPWAATLRALLVAAAPGPLRDEVGFGLPVLGSLLPRPFGAAPKLHVLQSHVEEAAPQRFCVRVTGAPATVVLAWTDPPDVAGALQHDLDLEVACGGFMLQLGNGEEDRANTVEKVLLTPTEGLCVISVAAHRASAPQPFALVLAGPFDAVPGCQAGECAQGAGPFCDLAPVVLPLLAAADTSRGVDLQLRPWQWVVFNLSACGPGVYELVLEHKSAVPLDVHASTTLGAHLWSSVGKTPAFTTSTTSGRGNVLSAELRGPTRIFAAVHWSGRDGPLHYTARWRERSPGCAPAPVAGAQRLRGGGDGQQHSMALYLALGLPTVVLPVLACVAVILCWRSRRRKTPPATGAVPG